MSAFRASARAVVDAPLPEVKVPGMDMSASYRATIRTGLPDAIVMVDHLHVVQLADKMLSVVRRRTTAEVRQRRGRAGGPEWKGRRCLLRNREDLTGEQFTIMRNKENLRNLLAPAPTATKSARPGGSSSRGSRIPTSPKCDNSPPPSTAGGPRSPRSSTPARRAGARVPLPGNQEPCFADAKQGSDMRLRSNLRVGTTGFEPATP
ncbi:transposase [Streptomyces sp. NPDC054834]